MEITNLGVNNPPLTPQAQVEAAPAASKQTTSAVASDSSAYTPSPELTRLLDQVRAQPEVRADRVQAAVERLQQGFYHTHSSIEQTAQAMSGAGE